MKLGKRNAKRHVDQFLSFASVKKMGDLPEPKLRRLFLQFFEIVYGAGKERENYYDALCANSASLIYHLQRLAGQLHSLIQEIREQAGRDIDKKKWRAIPGRPFRFYVSYDLYFKDDKVSVRPLGETRISTKAKKDEGVGLMRSLEEGEKESSNLLKYRLFSLLEEAELPLSSIRVCAKCKRFFSATERKKDKRCRKCLQRDIRRKWGKERGL